MIPEKLQKWIDKKIFPQRILLSGSGKTVDIALEIASQLQKTSRENIEKGIHSDTIVFRDNGKSFKIGVDEKDKEQGEFENVRGLIRWAHQKPAEGEFRIVILENLERLTDAAPHACLKLIEEPPSRTIFLFTTQNHHHQKLLSTILSRVIVVRIPSPKSDLDPSSLAYDFMKTSHLIERFNIIQDLDMQSKDNKEKKINRTVFYDFLKDLLFLCRKNPVHYKNLEIVMQSYEALQRNVNPKLVLERLVVKM